jgi:hypothetical protein
MSGVSLPLWLLSLQAPPVAPLPLLLLTTASQQNIHHRCYLCFHHPSNTRNIDTIIVSIHTYAHLGTMPSGISQRLPLLLHPSNICTRLYTKLAANLGTMLSGTSQRLTLLLWLLHPSKHALLWAK